jgi:8-oxo-dGTP pyrophosphatase MutT (NUDIX family)
MTLVQVDRLDLVLTPRLWPFAAQKRDEIDAFFDEQRRLKPTLWNGQLLLLHDYAIRDAVFHGTYLQTDFASMLAWRQWNFPDPSVRSCFAMGAVQGSDGAFLLGVMAAHTANAGKIYFPAGTPEPSDVIGSRVDLAGGLMREVAEETGLTASDLDPQPGWTTVLAGPRIAQIKVLRARETAQCLRRRILTHLKSQTQPELADIRVVRKEADFDPTMPSYITDFLLHEWQKQ